MKYKTIASFASFAAVLAAASGLSVAQTAVPHGDPFTPDGSLNVTPTVVQPGVQPNMNWEIEYPKKVSDIGVIIPPGRIVLTEKTDVKIRVAGVGFKSEGEESSASLDVGLWVKVGSDPWELIYYGTEEDVQPAEFVYEKKNVPEGSVIDFLARGRAENGSWYSYRSTYVDDLTVSAQVNGDELPDYVSDFVNGGLEGYMTQFVGDDNYVVVGPRDILYTFELGATDPAHQSFDMQDIVAVCTIGKNNNGHGNNLDGVDVSNPGQGHGGPNGEEDASGSVDDEGKIPRGKKNK